MSAANEPLPDIAPDEDVSAAGSPSRASPQSPHHRQNSQGTKLDLAVNFMLSQHARLKHDDFDVKAVHDMDTRYVQTAASEMSDGDTLILLNVPKGHKPNRSCMGGSFPSSYRLRLPSPILRNCGLDLFPRLLDDQKYQAKNRARLASREVIPSGVQYILDLGPSTDEDLHSSHLECLSLSRGIVRWYRTFAVPPHINLALVHGHDDCCQCASVRYEAMETLPEKEVCCLWDRSIAEPKYREIEDYCEVRHAANVVRLLRRIMGKLSGQLVLDSAPRVFTIAGLAKLFEINFSQQSTWLRDDLLTWFLADGNTEIMEILAEDAILIGFNAKIPEVTRAAYRFLTSEYALQLEASVPAPRGGHKYSVFGRPLRDINNDVIQTAIEHGGQALAERVLGTLARLQSDGVFDWLCIEEWAKIKLLEHKLQQPTGNSGSSAGIEAIQAACYSLKEALAKFIRSRVTDALTLPKESDSLDVYNNNISHFVPKHRQNKNGFKGFWNALNDNQKALTSIFWRSLGTRWPGTIKVQAAAAFRFKWLAKNLNDSLSAHGFTISDYVPEHFDIDRMIAQLEQRVREWICTPLWDISSSRLGPGKQELQHLFISSHMLTGLNESEMRFLPLWADGLNDESGGVYDSAIPPSDLGPSGPGPSFHTGQTVGTETTNSTVSDLGLDDMDIKSFTTATKTNAAHRGPSSARPSTREPGASDDVDFDDARYAMPAEHQVAAQAALQIIIPADSISNSDDDDSMRFSLVGDEDDEGNDDAKDFSSGSTTPTASIVGSFDVDRDSDWSMA